MGPWCACAELWHFFFLSVLTPSTGQEQHGKTGLTAACLEASAGMREVEDQILKYTDKHFPEPKALLSGSSVHVDKKWLVRVFISWSLFDEIPS